MIRLPGAVRKILNSLHGAGFEASAVGGCVRDSILGKTPKDWDVTTSARPEEVKALFRRTIDTGIQHGTVTVMIDREGYEITTYRIDGKYEDSRHPSEVIFTPSLEEDLKRRDFTINALSADVKDKIFDYTTGRSDLAQGLVRFIGDPEKRIQEDYLRILRYFRFWSAISSLDLDSNVLQACKRHKKGLEILSADRIRDELFRLFCTPRAEEALLAMKKVGVLTSKMLTLDFSKKQMQILKKMEKEKLLAKIGFLNFKGGKNDHSK